MPRRSNKSKSKNSSYFSLVWRRFRSHRLALLGLLLLTVLGGLSVLAPFLAPNPNAFDLYALQLYASPSPQHPLGTDELGRDVLSRLLHGGRISLGVGIVSAAICTVVGVVVGATAGYMGGRIDSVISRTIDFLLCLPMLPLLLILSALLSLSDLPLLVALRENYQDTFSLVLVVFVICLFGWIEIARLVRSDILRLKQFEYTEAARALGASHGRTLFRHLLPSGMANILVAATLLTGNAILAESALSFLGFGVQAPLATWGNMLSSAQELVLDYPLLTFYPGLMILLTVLAFNFLGDGLRDAFDPRIS